MADFQPAPDYSVASLLEEGFGAGRFAKEVLGWTEDTGGIYFFKLLPGAESKATGILGRSALSPIPYVGRSRKICQRLVNHFKGKGHNSASLVYKITCNKLNAAGQTRDANMDNPAFLEEFETIRVFLANNIRVAFFREENPVRQALLEILFSQRFESDFNEWETH